MTRMISLSRKIFLIASHVSLAGLLYGLDTGKPLVNFQSCFFEEESLKQHSENKARFGVITQMDQANSSIGHLSSMQQGIYVACILLSSSVSSLASGHISSDRVSRKYGILLGGILSTVDFHKTGNDDDSDREYVYPS